MLLKVSDCPFDGVCVCLREKDRESERECGTDGYCFCLGILILNLCCYLFVVCLFVC